MSTNPASPGSPPPPWMPQNFIERIGAALAAPRHALVAADSGPSAHKVGSDAAVLLGILFAVVHTRELFAALWLGAVDGISHGLMTLLNSLSLALAMNLGFLFVAALALTVLAGRKRDRDRDFDLACVALVPLVAVEITAELAVKALHVHTPAFLAPAVLVVQYGWALAILYLAWRVARSRPHPAADPDRTRAVHRAARSRRAGTLLAMMATVLIAVNGAWIGTHLSLLRPVSSGELAPGFALPLIDDQGAVSDRTVALEELRGHVVLVDFWATWCKPCLNAMPAIEAVHQRYRDRGLKVMSVTMDDPDKARAVSRSMGLTFPLFADDGTVTDLYNVTSIPHMVLIDRRGVVRRVHRFFDEDTLVRDVVELLNVPGMPAGHNHEHAGEHAHGHTH